MIYDVAHIVLGWPDKHLNPNSPDRHWRKKQPYRVDAREGAYLLTLATAQTMAGYTGPLMMRVNFFPPDRRRRDLDNLLASLKPSIDGICKALDIDDSRIKWTVLVRDVVKSGGEVVIDIKPPEAHYEEIS